MFAAKRQAIILRAVEEEGAVSVASLASELGVSDVTIRRDLRRLTDQGLLEKVHGGATSSDFRSGSFEPAFDDTLNQEVASKTAIAKTAASLVSHGQSLALLGGSTVFALARELIDHENLTIVTNSLPIFQLFSKRGAGRHSVILAGGTHTPTNCLVGPVAIAGFGQFHVDSVFMGCFGMDSEHGFSTPNVLEAQLNQAVMSQADRVCMLADHTKWGLRGFATFASLRQADDILTTTLLPPNAERAIRSSGARLHFADPTDSVG